MEIRQVSCYVCAYEEDGRIMELRFEPVDRKSSLGNIYVGQIENVAANIGAAFVQISANEKCYLQLSDAQSAIYTSVRKGTRPLKSGDEILVQISRDAMKGKLPAVTTNLNFTGKYLVLTTGDKKFGLSSKLSNEDRSRLSKWMEEEINRPDKEFGIIVRTNAADASKEEIQKELEYLKGLYQKAAVDGRSRTCFSCVYRTEPFYISAVRDANSRNLEEIVTDIPEISQQISDYLENNSPEEKDKLRFYEDKLLPLYKLHRLETVLEEIAAEEEDYSHLVFSAVKFVNCRFWNCSFERCEFTDVIFESCDFSGCNLSNTYFNRAEYLSCKGVGTKFAGSVCKNMVLRECNLNYANFDACKLENLLVDKTELNSSNLTQCKCKDIQWRQAALTNASFFKTPMRGMDFSDSEIKGLVLSDDNQELKGAVVDLYQAAQLSKRLGIIIKDIEGI